MIEIVLLLVVWAVLLVYALKQEATPSHKCRVIATKLVDKMLAREEAMGPWDDYQADLAEPLPEAWRTIPPELKTVVYSDGQVVND